MPDISKPAIFTKELLHIIETKKTQLGFSYICWGDADLEPVRKFLRDYYRTVQNGNCAFCKQPVSLVSALNCNVEHIVPKSLHEEFMFIPQNLCVICADCNHIKRNQETLSTIPDTLVQSSTRIKYPRSSNGFEIIHPHFDKYNEHIEIVNGYYLDKSKKGHFTIGACKLNRKLYEFGWEPAIIDEEQVLEVVTEYIDDTNPVSRGRILTKLKALLFS